MNPHTPKAVIDLLAMYQQYASLLSDLHEVEGRYAKAKILNTDSSDLVIKRQQLTSHLQRISDAMTFADPLIWIQYKYYAYRNDAQPITTMHDFRVHCSKLGDICTKRFAFVNEAFTKSGLNDLNNKLAYKDELELSELFDNPALKQLVEDEQFMDKWKQYEYHQKDGVVAKWQNYLTKTADKSPQK